jgi:hypothetical protein
MSCTLYYEPVREGKSVGDFQLRDAICERFGSDGELDAGALEFLAGLAAAKVEGAGKLIAAIDKYGRIRFWREC